MAGADVEVDKGKNQDSMARSRHDTRNRPKGRRARGSGMGPARPCSQPRERHGSTCSARAVARAGQSIFERSTAIPRVGRHAGAGAAVLLVPRVGADAEDTRLARPPARGEGCGVESVIGMPDFVRRTHGVEAATDSPQKIFADSGNILGSALLKVRRGAPPTPHPNAAPQGPEQFRGGAFFCGTGPQLIGPSVRAAVSRLTPRAPDTPTPGRS
jgi:hypothetical protein